MNVVCNGLLICTFFFAVSCQAGEMCSDATLEQRRAVESLKKGPEMGQGLRKCFAAVDGARREAEKFQAKVSTGDIPIKNNNGLWCAVLDESKTVTKLATYMPKDGPMDYFMKVVYSDTNHQARVNEQGYELRFYTNGMLKAYTRGDMQEMSEYHPDGKIKSYSTKTGTRWYTAKWDDNDGRLLNETSSIGTVGEPSKSLKKDE